MTKLMNKDPYLRYNGDFSELKIHPFFRGFDFVSYTDTVYINIFRGN